MNVLVCDLQYGSTGKGLICYYLANKNKSDIAIAAYTPNAGHTVIIDGVRYIHSALPMASLVDTVREIGIGPGAVVDPERIITECENGNGLIDDKTLYVHPSAMFLIREDSESEKELIRIGSTMKGTAAANYRRMERGPYTVFGQCPSLCARLSYMLYEGHGIKSYFSKEKYNDLVHSQKQKIVEGAQGYSLSVYHGHYPYVTSRDTTPNQIAADCGLSSNYSINYMIVGAMRTYPIRVANRLDEDGNQVGYSGPWYPDQSELSWSDIGIDPELTTVTKLPRRIATYSRIQIDEAIRTCFPATVFLNFCNYADESLLERIENDVIRAGSKVAWQGYGPEPGDIREINT